MESPIPIRPSQTSIQPRNGVTFVILAVIIVVFGVAAAQGSAFLAFLLPITCLGAIAVFAPTFLAFASLALCLVGSGSLETFADIAQASWGASVVVGGLVLATLLSKPQLALITAGWQRKSWSRRLMSLSIGTYFFSLALSAIVNAAPLAQLLAGARNYLPFLGVYLILAKDRLPERRVRQLLWALISVACIQWLFCLAEQFFIVPRRVAALASIGGPGEAIVGSFGGNPLVGGYTGEMAAFVSMTFILCLVLGRRHVLPLWVVLASGISAMVSVGLAEAKIVFVLLPLMVVAVGWRYPGRVGRDLLPLAFAVALCTAIIVAVYAERYWGDLDQFFQAFSYSFDPRFMVDPYHRGRLATLVHWWQTALIAGPVPQAILGYGPSASMESSAIAGMGTAVIKFGLGLDNNALSKLLWDVGLFGTVAFVLIIVGAFFEATRLSHISSVAPWLRYSLVGIKAWLVAFAVMLPYQVSVIGGPPMQFLFWFSLALVSYAGSTEAGIRARCDAQPRQ